MKKLHKALVTMTAAAALTLVLSGCETIPGEPGAKGEQGLPGIQGAQGEQGLPGLPGDPSELAVVVFDTAGGDEIAPLLIKKGDGLTLPSANRFGYDLEGWYIGEGLDETEIPDGETVEGNMTLTAKWSPKAVLWSEISKYNEAGYDIDVEFYHPDGEAVQILIVSGEESFDMDSAVKAGIIDGDFELVYDGGLSELNLRFLRSGEYNIRIADYRGKYTDLPMINVGEYVIDGIHICEGGIFNDNYYQSANNPIISVLESDLLGVPLELNFNMPYDMEVVSATNNGEEITVISSERQTYSFDVYVDTSTLKVGENKIEVKVNNPKYGEATALWTINVLAEAPTENTILYSQNFYNAVHNERINGEVFGLRVYCVNGEEELYSYNFVTEYTVKNEAGDVVSYVDGTPVEFYEYIRFDDKMMFVQSTLDIDYQNGKYLAPGKYTVYADIKTDKGAPVISTQFEYHVWQNVILDASLCIGEEKTYTKTIAHEIKSLTLDGHVILADTEAVIEIENAVFKVKFTVSEGVTNIEYTVSVDYDGRESLWIDQSVLVETAEGVKYYCYTLDGVNASSPEINITEETLTFKGTAYAIEQLFPEFITGEGAVAELVAFYEFVNADFSSMTYEEVMEYVDYFKYYQMADAAVEALSACGALPEGESWFDAILLAREPVLEKTGIDESLLFGIGPFYFDYDPEYAEYENTYAVQLELLTSVSDYILKDEYVLAAELFRKSYKSVIEYGPYNPEVYGLYLQVDGMLEEYERASFNNSENADELRERFTENAFKLYVLMNTVYTGFPFYI